MKNLFFGACAIICGVSAAAILSPHAQAKEKPEKVIEFIDGYKSNNPHHVAYVAGAVNATIHVLYNSDNLCNHIPDKNTYSNEVIELLDDTKEFHEMENIDFALHIATMKIFKCKRG